MRCCRYCRAREFASPNDPAMKRKAASLSVYAPMNLWKSASLYSGRGVLSWRGFRCLEEGLAAYVDFKRFLSCDGLFPVPFVDESYLCLTFLNRKKNENLCPAGAY